MSCWRNHAQQGALADGHASLGDNTRISVTAKLFIAIILLSASAIAEPFNRLTTFRSCDEFIAALKALKPGEQPNIYSRALSIEDFGEGHSDALIVPDAVDTVTEVWRSEDCAIVFATARPKTEASNSIVGIVITLAYINDAWRFTGLRRYEAIGKYSEITCKASFHHTPAHIRKALDIVSRGDISAKDFVNGEEPLTNLLEVMRHLMSHNGHLKTAIIP